MMRFFLLLAFLLSVSLSYADALYLNKGRGFSPLVADGSGSLCNSSCHEKTYPIPFALSGRSFSLSMRLASKHGVADFSYAIECEEGRKSKVVNPAWGLRFYGRDGELTISFHPEAAHDILGGEGVNLRLNVESRDSIILSSVIKKHFSALGSNLLHLEMRGEEWMLDFGNDSRLNKFSFSPPQQEMTPESVQLILQPGAMIDLSSFSIETPEEICSPEVMEVMTIADILENSADPICGLWELYDFTIQDDLLSIPSKLRIAILPDGEYGYSLYYVGGYKAGTPWKPGMKKGRLCPSSFSDIYDVVWMDASMKGMSEGITATTTEYPIIALQFTPQSSLLRFRRVEEQVRRKTLTP